MISSYTLRKNCERTGAGTADDGQRRLCAVFYGGGNRAQRRKTATGLHSLSVFLYSENR